jgi:hypothetical protein
MSLHVDLSEDGGGSQESGHCATWSCKDLNVTLTWQRPPCDRQKHIGWTPHNTALCNRTSRPSKVRNQLSTGHT